MGYRFLGESRSKAGHCERVSERSLHFADNAIGSCQFVQQFYAVPNAGDPHTNRNALYQLLDIPVEASRIAGLDGNVQEWLWAWVRAACMGLVVGIGKFTFTLHHANYTRRPNLATYLIFLPHGSGNITGDFAFLY